MTTSYIGSSLITQKLTELETALSVANTAISDSNLSIAAANNKVSALENWSSDRVKYVYPNGGSEGQESQITGNNAYFMASPFPSGTAFSAKAQVKVGTDWEDVGAFIYNGSQNIGIGANCTVRVDGVCLATGDGGLGSVRQHTGSYSSNSGTIFGTLLFRIKCIRED